MKPLDCREWLEAERVAGNDWAREALTALDVAEDHERGQDDAKEMVEQCESLLRDYADGKTIADQVEAVTRRLDDLVDLEDVARDYIDRFRGVWDVLTDAGVVDKNANVSDADVPSLLRMFLPC